MSRRIFRTVPLHNKAFLVEWEQKPSDKLLEIILSFKSAIDKDAKVSRTVMGYQSLLIHMKEEIQNMSLWNEYLNELQIKIQPKRIDKGKIWKIPVCYDNIFAPDLIPLAKSLKIEVEELIQIHSETKYRVYFIGFLPGFLYLNGLDKRLHFPRKKKPQLKVPKGAIGIGGRQTGVYPNESPGGWHLIGKTPISLFDAKQKNPCFASPGDWLSFEPIDKRKYYELERKIQKDNFKMLPTQ